MDQKTRKTYLKLLVTAKEDSEYRQLCAECEWLNGPVLDLLGRLPEADKELLMDYIGVIGAANLRLVVLAYNSPSIHSTSDD